MITRITILLHAAGCLSPSFPYLSTYLPTYVLTWYEALELGIQLELMRFVTVDVEEEILDLLPHLNWYVCR